MLKKIVSHTFLLALAFLILLPIIWIILASFTETTHASYVIERIFKPDYFKTEVNANRLNVKYKIGQRNMEGEKSFEFGPEYAGKHIQIRIMDIETVNEELGYSEYKQTLSFVSMDTRPDSWLYNFQLGGIGQVPDSDDYILKNKTEGFKLKHKLIDVAIQTDTGIETNKTIVVSYNNGEEIISKEFIFGTEVADKQVLISYSKKDNQIYATFSDKEFKPHFGMMSFDIDNNGNISRPIIINNQVLITYFNVLTIQNYKEILFDNNFRNWLANSFLVALFTAGISVLLGFFAGYSFSRFKFPGRQISMLWVIATQLFPLAMMIVPFYILAAGILPMAIPGFSIVNTRWGLVVIYTATALPFSIWMLKGYFDTIPTDLEEAAAIDGASLGQLLALILFPLARPAMFTAFLFSFVQAWNEYAISSMFMTKVEMLTLPVGLQTLMGGAGSFNQNIAWFAAGAVIVSIPIILLFLSMKKELVESSTLGAIKG